MQAHLYTRTYLVVTVDARRGAAHGATRSTDRPHWQLHAVNDDITASRIPSYTHCEILTTHSRYKRQIGLSIGLRNFTSRYTVGETNWLGYAEMTYFGHVIRKDG